MTLSIDWEDMAGMRFWGEGDLFGGRWKYVDCMKIS